MHPKVAQETGIVIKRLGPLNTHTFRYAFVSLLVIGAVMVMACSSDSKASSTDTKGGSNAGNVPAGDASAVTVEMFKFTPPLLQVKSGASVTWTNRDEILHTITAGTSDSPSGAFDGQLTGVGVQFRFVFTQPGSYKFFCSRHQFMQGEIVVSP